MGRQLITIKKATEIRECDLEEIKDYIECRVFSAYSPAPRGEVLYGSNRNVRMIEPLWRDDGVLTCKRYAVPCDDGEKEFVDWLDCCEKDVLLLREEVERFKGKNGQPDVPHAVKACNLPPRENVPPRCKAPLTLILEHVFDAIDRGESVDVRSWDSVCKFLKEELAKEAKLSDGQNIGFYLNKIITTGTNRGFVMASTISGKKLDKHDNHHPEEYVKQQFSRLKSKRCKMK